MDNYFTLNGVGVYVNKILNSNDKDFIKYLKIEVNDWLRLIKTYEEQNKHKPSPNQLHLLTENEES